MTDNEETRSYNEILQDNAKLRADNSALLIQLAQAMQFIDNCGRAIEVTGQLEDNPNLKSVGVQAEGQAAGVDKKLAAFMFEKGICWLTFDTRDYTNNPTYNDGVAKAIKAWKAQQADNE